jgi:hypothetical protein
MRYLNDRMGLADADSSEDATMPTERLQQLIDDANERLQKLPEENEIERAELKIRMASAMVDLDKGEEAFTVAREAFDTCARLEYWDGAVQACDVMFQAEQPDSLAALGNGVWLSVTFPVDAELTVALLNHIIDETPDDSDGAGVAAAVAHYIADIRAQEGKQHDDLIFFTNKLLGEVARRHSNIEKQEQFDFWVEKLELNDPAKFLPRLRNVVDVMVQEQWWIDREAIWASLPDQ